VAPVIITFTVRDQITTHHALASQAVGLHPDVGGAGEDPDDARVRLLVGPGDLQCVVRRTILPDDQFDREVALLFHDALDCLRYKLSVPVSEHADTDLRLPEQEGSIMDVDRLRRLARRGA